MVISQLTIFILTNIIKNTKRMSVGRKLSYAIICITMFNGMSDDCVCYGSEIFWFKKIDNVIQNLAVQCNECNVLMLK